MFPSTEPSITNVLLVNLQTRLTKAHKEKPVEDETISLLLADAYSLTYRLLQIHGKETAQRILLSNVAFSDVHVCQDSHGKNLIDFRKYASNEDAPELRGKLDQVYREIDAIMPLAEGPIAKWERIEALLP